MVLGTKKVESKTLRNEVKNCEGDKRFCDLEVGCDKGT